MITDLEWFLNEKTKNRYLQLGRTHKRVYLFEGIPGSGKTSFISALASKFGYDLSIINFTAKVDDAVIIHLFSSLSDKTFIVLEDIDCLFEDRKKNDSTKNSVTFSGILNSLDGITTPDNLICFMTTNYKNSLDPAILRLGRIDKIITFEHIKKKEIYEIFTLYSGDNYTKEYGDLFYKKYIELNINGPVALMQEYLFKYLDEPTKAIENIDEIKDIFNASFKKNADIYS